MLRLTQVTVRWEAGRIAERTRHQNSRAPQHDSALWAVIPKSMSNAHA
jgi:hypothetical protein